MKKLKAPIGLLAAVTIMGVSTMAHVGAAQPVTNYDDGIEVLATYVGEWSARGTSRRGFDEQPEAARCNIAVSLDPASAVLTNTGRCAIALGSVDVNGTLVLNSDGSLGGAFLGGIAGAVLQQSRGQLYAEGFAVEASYLIDSEGAQQDMDVTVRASAPVVLSDGRHAFNFIVEGAHPDTGAIVELSSFVFVRRG